MEQVYEVKTTFDTFRFSADLSQASEPICVIINDETESMTPFQTADARHNPYNAAIMLISYWGPDYWLDPTDEVSRGDDGDTLFNGKARDDYISDLILSVDTVG